MDLFSALIYSSLLIIVFTLSKISVSTSSNHSSQSFINFDKFLFLALLMISLVVGLRFDVGVDWQGYVTDFEFLAYSSQSISFQQQPYELGYYLLSILSINLGFGYPFLFFTVAFISWFNIFQSLELKILPLFILFLFFDEHFFWSMNGARQFMAISFFLMAFRLYISEKYVLAISIILLGSLFHKSILLILPFLFIPYKRLFNQSIFLIIYSISFLIFLNEINFIDSVIKMIYSVFDSFGSRYLRYLENDKVSIVNQATFGIGAYFKFIINFFILLMSSELLKIKPKLKPYLVLFFLGIVIFNLFYQYQLFMRFNAYFLILRSFLLAHIFYFLFKESSYKLFFIIFFIAYLFGFFILIYNSNNGCSPYMFI